AAGAMRSCGAAGSCLWAALVVRPRLRGEGPRALERNPHHGWATGSAVDPAFAAEQAHTLVHRQQPDAPFACGADHRGLEVETATVVADLCAHSLRIGRHADLDLGRPRVLADVGKC